MKFHHLIWNAIQGQNGAQPREVVENIFQVEAGHRFEARQVEVGLDPVCVLLGVADGQRELQAVRHGFEPGHQWIVVQFDRCAEQFFEAELEDRKTDLLSSKFSVSQGNASSISGIHSVVMMLELSNKA